MACTGRTLTPGWRKQLHPVSWDTSAALQTLLAHYPVVPSIVLKLQLFLCINLQFWEGFAGRNSQILS